jgi:hypothetical protein
MFGMRATSRSVARGAGEADLSRSQSCEPRAVASLAGGVLPPGDAHRSRRFPLRAGSELSLWVGEQQKAHRHGGLGKRRTKRLAALPGWDLHTTPFKPVTDS